MKSYTKPTESVRRNGGDKVSPVAPLFTLFAVCLFALALALVAGGATGAVGAAPHQQSATTSNMGMRQDDLAQPVTPTATIRAGETLTESQPVPLATPTVSSSDAAPPGQPGTATTPVVPGAATTQVVVPNSQITNVSGTPFAPAPIDTTSPSNPNVTDPGVPPQPGSPTPAQDGGFPWLPVVLVGLAALIGAGFVLMRGRPGTPAAVTAAATTPVALEEPATARLDAEGGEVVTTTLVEPDVAASEGAGATTVAPPITVTTASVAPVVAVAAAPVAPTEVTCPNCGTANGIEENFCHECGQDLRGARAAAVAAAAAAAPVAAAEPDIDTLPYLETLDRVDEQLEYVLSRPRVLMGGAPGNDIVINADFRGYRSVSPVHAELRRDEAGYLLRDRESERGTHVNDSRIGERVLADGDTLRLGEVRFVFHVPEGDQD